MIKFFLVFSLVIHLVLVPPVNNTSPCYPLPADICNVGEAPELKYNVYAPIVIVNVVDETGVNNHADTRSDSPH